VHKVAGVLFDEMAGLAIQAVHKLLAKLGGVDVALFGGDTVFGGDVMVSLHVIGFDPLQSTDS